MTINKGVRKAAAFLDAIYEADKCCREQLEGWRSKIDASDLDMDSLGRCVLGQLFGCYIDGKELVQDWSDSGVDTPEFGILEWEDVYSSFDNEEKNGDSWRELLRNKAEFPYVLKDVNGTWAYEVHAHVDVAGVTHFVVRSGRVLNNEFEARETADAKVWPESSFSGYEKWTPEDEPKFITGRFYKSKGGKYLYFAKADAEIWYLKGGVLEDENNVTWTGPRNAALSAKSDGGLIELKKSGGVFSV